jgi:hypothetical protein
MTLHDLTEQLAPYFPASVQKDLKTHIRFLAQALDYSDPKSCPLEACLKPLPELYQCLEVWLTAQQKGPHTIRNTKNSVSRLFRLAEMQRLFSLLPAQPKRRFKFDDVPHRFRDTTRLHDQSHLPRRVWPAALEAEFARFSQWATDPLVDGRDAKLRKREVTVNTYEHIFETYFGYLHHQLHIQPVRFDHLCNLALLERFILWHINEKWKRPTRTAHTLVKCVRAMASQYLGDVALAEALKALRKRLPPLRPVYNKNDAWISLQELQTVAAALWPTTTPAALIAHYKGGRSAAGAGRKSAARAGISLMLQLWIHIPYRQRNMREMQLDHNLYKTTEGHWRIRFASDELKIASKQGHPNVFDLPLPVLLIPVLESYLTTWRPILAHIRNATEVFLNHHGRPYTIKTVNHVIKGHIYSYTGRLWHPHIMRTIWATEWIRTSGDFMTAAIMLNDRLETVIKNYSHLRDENVAEKAFEWVQTRVNYH